MYKEKECPSSNRKYREPTDTLTYSICKQDLDDLLEMTELNTKQDRETEILNTQSSVTEQDLYLNYVESKQTYTELISSR